ncbi:ABC-three component system protein [Curtobacterium sp. NPDC089991]|uniref:ABC-three component system protein n=1 Tax=Curtobacterium sp. NPDC089991 TaxID=3363969 RepID=UPI00382D7ADA
MPANSHDAAASALGYLHQIDWALLEMIRTGPTRPDHGIMLEQHDDVSWVNGASPTELLQVKHHADRKGGLSDMSVDLWTTFQVWMDDKKFVDPSGPALGIVTTSTASPGTAASLLRPVGRDQEQALELLDTAALTSNNGETAATRSAWLDLDENVRRDFLARVTVLDASPTIGDVTGQIREALYWVVNDPQRQDLFLQDLFGWWHMVAIDMLQKTRGPINAVQVSVHLDQLKERYGPNSLPPTIDRVLDDAAGELEAQYSHRIFVKQLGFIDVRTRAIQMAILDFHNAVAQTTDWADRSLLDMREFDRFKDALAEEWAWAFEEMMSQVADDADEEERKRLGRALFFRLRDSTQHHIHDSYRERFYNTGVQLELADEARHGWHPDFESLLEGVMVTGV